MAYANPHQPLSTTGRSLPRTGLFLRLLAAFSGALAARDAFERLSRESDAQLAARNVTRDEEMVRIARAL